MVVGKISSRLSSRNALAQFRNSLLLYARPQPYHQQNPQQYIIPLFNQSRFLHQYHNNKVIAGQESVLHHSILGPFSFQQFGFSSSATSQPEEKETVQSGKDQKKSSGPNRKEELGDVDLDLSVEDLMKLVAEKEEIVMAKNKEIKTMNDKVLRAYAEMENVKDRTRREAENSKKFAIQNFAKSLLDVADNMGRASSVVKDSFAKIDTSKDTAGAVPLLKTLLEGVEMTEKQLSEVFKKFGVEKYDPTNEQFDPHRHNAVFQVPDPSKAPDTVAVVLKPGYTLYDRVIRPAEVGVTVEVDKREGSDV